MTVYIYYLKPSLTDEIETKSSNNHLLLPLFSQHKTSGIKVQTKFQSEIQQFHNTTNIKLFFIKTRLNQSSARKSLILYLLLGSFQSSSVIKTTCINSRWITGLCISNLLVMMVELVPFPKMNLLPAPVFTHQEISGHKLSTSNNIETWIFFVIYGWNVFRIFFRLP